jgi:hypothetical protein
MKTISILTMLMVLALLATGCGGSDEATLSKAELIKQGDAVCKKVIADSFEDGLAYARKNQARLSRLDPEAARGQVLTAGAVPAVQKGLNELESLGEPGEGKEELAAFLSEAKSALKKMEEEPASNAAASGDVFEKPNRSARAYGFKYCSTLP